MCGEAHVQAPDESPNSNYSTKNISEPSAYFPGRRGGAAGAGAGAGTGAPDESFVVLPDSTPVLAESYFSLSRYGTSAAGGSGVSLGATTGAVHTSREMSFVSTTPTIPGATMVSGVGRLSGFGGVGGGSDGPKVMDYGSGLGGWTESGFGAGSSMLESIVQISHAGLSDNVRRESLLHELSKRPARSPVDGDDCGRGEGGGEGGSSDVGNNLIDRGYCDEDPTLCCHCYASLLERIDDDRRLAERDALAYRDFVELLDSITDDLDQLSSPAAPITVPATTTACPDPHVAPAELHTPSQVDSSEEGEGAEKGNNLSSREPEGGLESNGRKASSSIGSVATGDTGGGDDDRGGGGLKAMNCGVGQEVAEVLISPLAADTAKTTISRVPGTTPQQHSERQERASEISTAVALEEGKKHSVETNIALIPYAHALRVAKQTSVQLRTELNSLETQREALCVRGSTTWTVLAELAYSRGVLGDECRELLRASREVK